MRFDMTASNLAESRVHEIALVTPTKAPELMSVFSRACFDLGRHLRDAYLASVRARKKAADRKAVMAIDVIPGLLKEKQLASNAETRQALTELDAEYSKLSDEEAQVEAVLLYIKRKIEDVEGALNAVKKILGESEGVFNRPNYNSFNTRFEEPREEPVQQVLTTDTRPPTNNPGGFAIGRARY